MIKQFVEQFETKKEDIRKVFESTPPRKGCYGDIVKTVVTVLNGIDGRHRPDPERIHEIDDGEYEGALVYVIAETGFIPNKYWYVMIDYGSCCGCDTLLQIQYANNEPTPTSQQVNDYMTLALHIVQELKEM
jgi:hypothetical protein